MTDGKRQMLTAPAVSLVALVLIPALLAAQNVAPGKNSLTVRGRVQYVYFYPGRNSADAPQGRILFAPGDGGWRGFATAVAETVANWGYDFYGLDTKQYLESFTGKTTLTETEVMTDIRAIADWIAPVRAGRVILLGWSEGAGLMVLAAAAEDRNKYVGVITMGLGDMNVLGWRFADNLTYITKKEPREPAFSSLTFIPRIAPLPIVMIQSSNDEYVARSEADRLFAAAREPKRFILVEARNHRFDGNQDEFFRQLRAAFEWVIQTNR